MYEFYRANKTMFDRILFLILVTLSVYLAFTQLFSFVAPFLFGLLIALLVEPIVKFTIKRFKWPRWAASLFCLLLFIGIISSIGVWLIATLINQTSAFIDSAPYHIGVFAARLEAFSVWLVRFEDMLPGGMYMPDLQESMVNIVASVLGDGVRDHGMRLASVVPNFFLNTIIMLVSAHFFISDRDIIFAAIRKACPRWVLSQTAQIKKGLSKAMAGYFRAQYILMLIIGIISIVGLLLLRSEFALFLGLLLAALDFLPILGTGAILVPWALISLAMGNVSQAVGLGVMYGVITIVRQVLQPKILGDQMGAHPLASLMSIFIGFRIFGLLGLVIGPSLLMIFIAIFETQEGDA